MVEFISTNLLKQRIRRVIGELADNSRPPQSKMLNLPDVEAEVWRLRLDNWRLLYAIAETDKIIDVLAIRKRPPYDYGDLETLLEELE
ncbi:type II toxin-antitoxin system RelE family toxin [Coleofasciculus sp. E1-EBD-02]|uniref:type II toxin-antitoxin system RelE family toxin n=1 Tax=Coleofasciculus sp. E1-EBD-02 TaxID=3068481 RepID=UPI0032F9D818